MASTVRIDAAAVQELLQGPTGPVVRFLTRKAIEVQNEAKRLCPVDTGRLRSSITYELRQSDHPYAVVGTDVTYARFIENGTGIYGPHKTPIRPVRAKFLAFKPRGSAVTVFARQIRGRPATPFLKPALDTVMRASA